MPNVKLINRLRKQQEKSDFSNSNNFKDPLFVRFCDNMYRIGAHNDDREKYLIDLAEVSIAIATELKVDFPPGDLGGNLAAQAYRLSMDLGRAIAELQYAVGDERESARKPAEECLRSTIDALHMFGRNVRWERFPTWLQSVSPPEVVIEPMVVPAAGEQYLEALPFGPQRDTRVPVGFVDGARATARSVARLRVPRIFGGRADDEYPCVFGTGWIIAPGLILTNHHVVEARDKRSPPSGLGECDASQEDINAQVSMLGAWFDYHADDPSKPPTCNGGVVRVMDSALDFALIELSEAAADAISGRTQLPLVRSQPPCQRGSRANIVQHPGGRAMRLAIRNNFFVGKAPKACFLRYQTETESGASGSPVCDDEWHVVGLHHASVEVQTQVVPQEVIDGQPRTVVLLNEAAEIHAILGFIERASPDFYIRIAKANGWLP